MLHSQGISKESHMHVLDNNLELIVSTKNRTQYCLEYHKGKRTELLGSYLSLPNHDFGKFT